MGKFVSLSPFGQRDNYHTELINFDIAHICLPYNAILGYPALAKFMAVTHHGYNVLKMSGKRRNHHSPLQRKRWVVLP